MKSYSIKIRRDANTITPTEVPLHEVAILQTIFGPENVQNAAGQRVDDIPLTEADVAGEFVLGDGEFDRLASKYGTNEEGIVVEVVYGKKASRGLDRAIEDAQEKEAAAAEAKSGKSKKAE